MVDCNKTSRSRRKSWRKSILNHRALLLSVLREGNRCKREDMPSHANGDQINVVSELNLSKKSTSIISTDGQIEKKHKIVLKELSKRKNFIKRRKSHLMNQKRSGFWQALHKAYCNCFQVWKKKKKMVTPWKFASIATKNYVPWLTYKIWRTEPNIGKKLMMPKAQSMQRFSKIFNATIVNETLVSTISTVIHASELPLVTGRIRTKHYWKKLSAPRTRRSGWHRNIWW